MQRYFGPQGILAQKVEGFEFRDSQLKMAEAVLECLNLERPLMVEAGTGTGKTWAYLLPAILSGKKVVVSTGTKTLQDQILDHDIPFLKRHIYPPLKAVCVKGRKNYLCRRRFQDFSYQPTLWNKSEARLFRRFQTWAVKTITGDRAEIHWLPDQFHTWNEVSSNSEQCLGQQCKHHSICFLTQLRQDASRAQILVVNHHLFFADLALRMKHIGEILPPYDAVVFDEAHQIEDIIGQYFGIEFSNLRINDLMCDLQRECGKKSPKIKNGQQIQHIAQQMDTLNRRLLHCLTQPTGVQGRFVLDIQKAGKPFTDTCNQIIHALEQLSALLNSERESDPVVESFNRRSLELAHAVGEILEQRDPSLVYWYEVSPHAVFIRGTPVDVAHIFQEHLLRQTGAVAVTSATLSVAGSFDYLRGSLGMPSEARSLLLPSPFAYDRQALLYIPSRFAPPQDPGFCGLAAEQAMAILAKTQGRALFLFTSYRNMNQVYQLLRDRLPYPILVQGQKPKRVLLAEFKEKVDSVLLATSSFWQGIDVPGEALSCLMIDKLPFEVPDDPVVASRMEQLEKQGKSAFFQYQVPRAIIQLKQGVGRLIRSSRDQGVIAIFDVRLLSKSYGRLFLKSLPLYRLTHDLAEIDDFLSGREVAPVDGRPKSCCGDANPRGS